MHCILLWEVHKYSNVTYVLLTLREALNSAYYKEASLTKSQLREDTIVNHAVEYLCLFRTCHDFRECIEFYLLRKTLSHLECLYVVSVDTSVAESAVKGEQHPGELGGVRVIGTGLAKARIDIHSSSVGKKDKSMTGSGAGLTDKSTGSGDGKSTMGSGVVGGLSIEVALCRLSVNEEDAAAYRGASCRLASGVTLRDVFGMLYKNSHSVYIRLGMHG